MSLREIRHELLGDGTLKAGSQVGRSCFQSRSNRGVAWKVGTR
jgi:hypothetical protein